MLELGEVSGGRGRGPGSRVALAEPGHTSGGSGERWDDNWRHFQKEAMILVWTKPIDFLIKSITITLLAKG